MTGRTEDRLVEHMRTCPDKPPRNPALEGQHFPHGNCPEYLDIIASVEIGPLIPFHEYMGWSDPNQTELGDGDYEDWVYRD